MVNSYKLHVFWKIKKSLWGIPGRLNRRHAGWAVRFLSFNAYCGLAKIRIWVNIHKTHRRLNLAPRSLIVYLYIDRVLKTCSTCLHLYPLHFDVKYIHIRIHIIFHENFTQKTISTASIYILQGNSTAAAGIQKSGSNIFSHSVYIFPIRIYFPASVYISHFVSIDNST